jgi:hypothetical protein
MSVRAACLSDVIPDYDYYIHPTHSRNWKNPEWVKQRERVLELKELYRYEWRKRGYMRSF